jgi:hypothetical protein
MEMQILLGLIVGGFVFIYIVIGIAGFFVFWTQSKGREYDIPPLDLVDAKKLDDMVSKQVESVLKPMLENKGYNEEQIKEILTRTSAGSPRFRR